MFLIQQLVRSILYSIRPNEFNFPLTYFLFGGAYLAFTAIVFAPPAILLVFSSVPLLMVFFRLAPVKERRNKLIVVAPAIVVLLLTYGGIKRNMNTVSEEIMTNCWTTLSFMVKKKITDQQRFIFNINDMDTVLKSMLKINPQHKMAFEYLMAYYLVNKDLDSFVENLYLIDEIHYTEIPKSCRFRSTQSKTVNGKDLSLSICEIFNETPGSVSDMR